MAKPLSSHVGTAEWRGHRLEGLMNTLGPLLSRHEGQTWAYGLRIDQRHLNQAGIVHGGVLSALMDQALSAIAWEHSGKSPCLTVHLNLNFLQAGRSGQILIARGKVMHRSGSMLFLEGTIHGHGNDTLPPQETLLATGHAIMKRLRKNSPT